MLTIDTAQVGGHAAEKRPSFHLKVTDPLACEPPARRKFGGRGHIHPRFTSLVIEGSPLTSGTTTATWGAARIRSTPNEQCVTFHLTQSSHSSFCPKTRRLNSGLGPHERSWAMEMAVDPLWVDFEPQGVTVALGDDPEKPDNSYRADWIGVDWNGVVHAGENKAHFSHYLDPDYSAKLTAAGLALGAISVEFRRDTGDVRRRNVRRILNVANAYGDAFTLVGEHHIAAIDDAMAKGGGTTTVGTIENAIGGATPAARSVVHAALCRRLISYDLDSRLDGDSVVVVPPTPPFITDIRSINRIVPL